MSGSAVGAAVLSPSGSVVLADDEFRSALATSRARTDSWLAGLCNLAMQSPDAVTRILVDDGAVLRFVAARRPTDALLQVTVVNVTASALDTCAGHSAYR